MRCNPDPLVEHGIVADLRRGRRRRKVALVDAVANHRLVPVVPQDLPAVREPTERALHVSHPSSSLRCRASGSAVAARRPRCSAGGCARTRAAGHGTSATGRGHAPRCPVDRPHRSRHRGSAPPWCAARDSRVPRCTVSPVGTTGRHAADSAGSPTRHTARRESVGKCRGQIVPEIQWVPGAISKGAISGVTSTVVALNASESRRPCCLVEAGIRKSRCHGWSTAPGSGTSNASSTNR